MIGRLLALIGSLLILLAAVGVVRFDDVYARLHTLAKASTIGMLLVLAGAAVSLHHTDDVLSAVLVAILQLITSPVAANAISTATYHSEGWQAGDRRDPSPTP
ncbi:MAG: monovalent cation/H(+) antiporter subunit G [Ilumatobacteraceae bacterium]